LGLDWIDKSLVVNFKSHYGILPLLPQLPVTKYSDSFSRVARVTDDIELDKIALRINRKEYDDLEMACTFLGYEFKPDDITLEKAVNITTAFAMYGAGRLLERAISNMVWCGNPANNTESGSYREFKGADLQIESAIECNLKRDRIGSVLDDLNSRTPSGIKLMAFAHPMLARILNEADDFLVSPDGSIQVEYLLGDKQLSSYLYVIPITANDDAPVTFLEYLDYRTAATIDIPNAANYFWTDEGRYAWMVDVEKWDIQLHVKNESRLILKRPDLAARLDIKATLPDD
jgi:hypothetical protein